ncbi:MAG: hypothetical protein RIS47_2292, partial [Bacteroidota bacterium]
MLKNQIISRFVTVYLFVGAIGVLIVLKTLYLQVIEHKKWSEKAQLQTIRDMIIEPQRGDIYSDEHRLLATSLPFYEIRMDMRSNGLKEEIFTQKIDSLADALSDLFADRTKFQYLKELKEAYTAGNRYYLIQKGVNFTQLKKMKTFPIFNRGRNKGGFIVIQENQRNKPFKSLAARTIGRLRNKGENHNVIGLEGAFDQELRGREGVRLMRKLSNNVWMPLNDENEVDPQDGYDLVTTLDVNIQDATEKALRRQLMAQKAHHGTAIVMEVATGAIRAIANLSISSDSVYRESYNYAVGEGTEPGSTFKLASIIVALEDNKIKLSDTIQTQNGIWNLYGFSIKDSKEGGHGLITAREAFEISSNVGIAKLIEKHYRDRPEEFVSRLYHMGLNQKLNIKIRGEGEPYIKYTTDKLWTRISLAQMSIGYEVILTPLQILSFYNAVANNGKLIRPQFASAIEYQGKVIQKFEPQVINPAICSQKTIDLAKQLLRGVVVRGTAMNINGSRYTIAGKTGTAKIFDNDTKTYIDEYKASFVGYFPADVPKYSCFVMISSPKTGLYYGNTVAAPVFKEIAESIYFQEVKNMESRPILVRNPDAIIPYTKNGDKNDLRDLLT